MKANVITIFMLVLLANAAYSQSLNNLTGYYNIPTAEVTGDRRVTVGANFLNRILYSKLGYRENSMAYFASIGYFPFLEFSLRFTKKIAPVKPEALGDRMISFKIRPFKESEYLPSVALGAQDFVHTKDELTDRFNALYIAATKNFPLGRYINNVSVTYGYGFNWISSRNHQYLGHFGGAEVKFLNVFSLITEYDGDRFNGGARVSLFNRFNILFGYLGFKYFSGGAAVSFIL